MIANLLPTMTSLPVAEVNLDAAAREHLAGIPSDAPNPLNDPAECQRMIDALHSRLGVDWSFGSYLEVRSTLLRGTYLDQSGNYLHVGVDCNVPAGTPIASPFDCSVVDLYDDGDYFHGWGPRVILEPVRASDCGSYLLLGHLMPLSLRAGERIGAGEIFSQVAPPPGNGNWFPHLHLQLLSPETFRRHALEGFEELDGYGHPASAGELCKEYPDPTWMIRNWVRPVSRYL